MASAMKLTMRFPSVPPSWPVASGLRLGRGSSETDQRSGLGRQADVQFHGEPERLSRRLAFTAPLALLAGCSGIPGSGPATADVVAGARVQDPSARFALVDLNNAIVTAMAEWGSPSLLASFGNQPPPSVQTIGIGDAVQIVIWEAAAGGLFSAPVYDRFSAGSRTATIPEQVVGADGAVTVPYAGRVRALGLTPSQVENEIVGSLRQKAIEPQALVTVTRNVTNSVTVIGEVTAGARIPLSLHGDRILDVVAAAGGVRVPVYEVFLTLMRGGRTARVPMQGLMAHPQDNIMVRPGDVVTVTREPQTFTAIGATERNSVVPFDAIGISLEEAIAKAGGLNDTRADPTGVFVIRLEIPNDYDMLGLPRPTPDPLERVPVIYRLDMRQPNALFIARRFAMRNKDILYVSNSPSVELQKILGIVQSLVSPAATIVYVNYVAKL
jgi:polysaccharide export outer membrane protein